MNNKNIYILTGPIGSGKTTMLLNWSKDRDDIAGILTPKVMNNRMFMNVKSGELFAMLAAEGETDFVSIGRYIFSQSAFNKAIKIIQNSIGKNGWLIIDEIGPLELRNEGFAEVFKEILYSKNREQNILLVVRDQLYDKIIEKFKIDNAMVMSNLNSLRSAEICKDDNHE